MASTPASHASAQAGWRQALADESDAERLRLLAESMPVICWLSDARGEPYWANQAAREQYGEPAADGRFALAELVHPDDLARAVAAWDKACLHRTPAEASVRTRGLDGIYRLFLTRVAPIRDEAGRVVRWCGVQTDLTERHAHDRRQAFLRAFHDGARDMTEPADVLDLLATMAFEHLAVDQMLYAEAAGQDERRYDVFSLRADQGADPGLTTGTMLLGPGFDAVIAAARAGRTLVVSDEADAPSLVGRALSAQGIATRLCAAIHVPVVRNGRVAGCLSLLSDRPRGWTADEVELCEELSERVWSTLDRVRADGRLKARERHQRFLIEWGDFLRRESDPDEIMRSTLERLGRHLGVTRTTYSEADGSQRAFTTRWDWCDGCPSLVGTRVAMDSIAPATVREWLAGDVVRYDDVGSDPRVDAADRPVYAERRIAAFVSIPLIRRGAVRSILSVQSAAPRTWQPSELELIRDMGERTWVALERARAQAELMERERTQAFMIAWGDRVRAETRPDVILDATLERLALHLGATRAVWAQITPDRAAYAVTNEWRRDGLPVQGPLWPLTALPAGLTAGDPLVCDDVREDPQLPLAARDLFAGGGVVARIAVPLTHDGTVLAILAVDCHEPHAWTPADAELVRDIADRVWALLQRARSEERLAESEALLAAFMEHAPLGMSLKDADGRYLRLNPELARLIGVPAEVAVGRLPAEILQPDSARQMAALGEAARAGQVASAEFDFPDRARYAAMLAVEFPIGGAGVARTGGITLDLTARKATEAELARSREALYQTEKLSALGSLLAGVSHELNNPLSIVVAQAVMLERQSAGSELATRAQKIRKAADRCARIVQTFLAMARQKQPQRAAVDLNAVAAQALELAEYGLRSDGISVIQRLAPDLPLIAADADQLHQIIVNLAVNAHHAMVGTTGDRVLTVTTRRGTEPHTVTLDVADTGPGISGDMSRRIFEPFFTTKAQGEGTGMGLSFSLGLAEAHGGRLALVPSEAGRGACFRLTLPIDADVRLPVAAPEPAGGQRPPPRRALLVDDEEEIAEALADFLGLEGYQCTIITSGEAACEALRDGNWDLVISDLRMPVVDGLQLHGWVLRHRPDLADRIGFVTGDTLGLQVAHFLDDSRRPVLEKPFTPDAVRQFLARFDQG